MKKLSIKIDGKKFIKSFLMDFKGQTEIKRCLCIPLEDNNIFESQKTGAAYIELTAIPYKEEREYGTHFLKLGVPKDKYNAMSEEQRNAIPFLGNVKPFGDDNGDGNQSFSSSNTPVYQAPTPGDNMAAGTADGGSLPF